MYSIIFDDGNIKLMVATNLTYTECTELIAKQERPECYCIIEM